MARRNRNLGGLAALGALGMAMARLGKKGPGEDVPMPENRGSMPQAASAAQVAAAQAAAQRHGGMQKHFEAPWLDAACQKSGDNAPWVISPFRHTWYDRLGKINRRHLGL